MGDAAGHVRRRLAAIIPAVLLATVVIFSLLRLLPGDVALVILSDTQHTVEMRELLREQLGLNRPLHVQYVTWLWSMLTGDFGGRSLHTGDPIAQMVRHQVPVTLLLTFYSLALAVLVSLPLAVVAARRRDRWPDHVIRVLSLGGTGLPEVWLGPLVLLVLLRLFRWSPPLIYATPFEDLRGHVEMMLWPAVILGWQASSRLVRVLRATLLDILPRKHLAAARARGLPERLVIWRHALRLALLPFLTSIGLQFAVLLGGALVLETFFGLPGLGRGLVQAAVARDYPVVQSLATVVVAAVLVVNLLVDVACAWADPRVTGGIR